MIHWLWSILIFVAGTGVGVLLICLCVSSGDVDRAERETRLRVALCKAVRVMEGDVTVDREKAIAEAYKVLGRR